jgi:Fis family transcriptional regulator
MGLINGKFSMLGNEINLKNFTRQTIKKYLHDMEGHQAKNLYDFVIAEIEKGIILEVMDFTAGNHTNASDILGITRTTLRNKIRKHKLFD